MVTCMRTEEEVKSCMVLITEYGITNARHCYRANRQPRGQVHRSQQSLVAILTSVEVEIGEINVQGENHVGRTQKPWYSDRDGLHRILWLIAG